MTNKRIDLQLSDLANGAVQEKLDIELKKIFDNIHDANTNASDKRAVTIKLEFKPDDNRQTVSVTSDFTTKLANVTGVSTTILTGRDISTGFIEAKELKSRAVGQTYIDPDDLIQKTDIGVPVDVIEREMKNSSVIDLQKKRG
jgi:hypothetical protein